MAATDGTQRVYSRTITGCTPGQLDPSQPSRLLRVPGSTLSFASFDPHAASPSTSFDIESLSIKDQLYTQKRVVIEVFPNGRSHWRFVPRAKWAAGVIDEGSWPRVVNIAGEAVLCSQDQWDIYKLDPAYECSVYPYAATITPKPDPPLAKPTSQAGDTRSKRRISSSSPDDDHDAPSAKRRREVIVISSDTDDDDEVQEMVIDSVDTAHRTRLVPKTHVPTRRTRRNGDDPRKSRLARAEEKAAQMNAGMPWEPSSVPSTPKMGAQSIPTPSSAKRKVPREGSPSEFSSGEAYKPSKRVRTKSPESIKYEAATKIKERRERRDKEAKRREELRREQRDRAFMEEIWEEIPDLPEDDDPEFDEGRAHEIALEESRRKLAELEKDKPLWDAAARERERREREEEARLHADAERRRRQAEEAERVKAEAAERERRAREDAEHRLREEEARREKERRARQQRERWARGPWTTERALERYRTLSEVFDTRRFSTSDPLSFEDVPWPILRAPLSFEAEDIDWSAVEAFFEAVRAHMRWQDYKAFVEKSHRRFHPDRWSSRGLLTTIADETERSMMEVAANTVAQALTPLWREAKGR